MFADMKVGTRLAVAFGAVLLLLIGMVVTGINRMAAVNTQLRAITDENNVESRESKEIRNSASIVAITVRDLIITSDTSIAHLAGALARPTRYARSLRHARQTLWPWRSLAIASFAATDRFPATRGASSESARSWIESARQTATERQGLQVVGRKAVPVMRWSNILALTTLGGKAS